MAASHVVALLIGIGVFSATFAVAMHYMESDALSEAAAAESAAAAGHALVLLVTAPGTSAWHVIDWESADWGGIDFIGLTPTESEPHVLDASKLAKLQGGAEFPAEDLAEALDIGDFNARVRVQPILFTLENGTLADFAGTTLAYVADHAGSVGASKVATPPSDAAARETLILHALNFDHNTAVAGAVDHASFGDRHPDSRIDLKRELLPRLAGFDSVTYETAAGDPSVWKVVGKGRYGDEAWWSAGTPERFLTASDWDATASRFSGTAREHAITLGTFDLTERPMPWAATLVVHHWFSPGSAPGSADAASIVARCVANCSHSDIDVVVWSSTGAVGSKGAFARTSVPLAAFSGTSMHVRFVYDRDAAPLGPTAGEGWFVAYTALNATHTETGAVHTAYENRLDYRTSFYDALVVGSGVDHQAFLASDGLVRHAVTDWVDAGGRMLVLGSEDADSAWLAPTFTSAGGTTAVGGLLAGASDLSHPLVSSPHALHVANHAYATRSWPASSAFSRVLEGSSPGNAGAREPLLSVSRHRGDFDGSVVLASAMPGAFASEEDAELALVDWLAFLVRSDAHLEFGESVPAKTPYGHASLPVAIPRASDGRAWPGSVTVFAWR